MHANVHTNIILFQTARNQGLNVTQEQAIAKVQELGTAF